MMRAWNEINRIINEEINANTLTGASIYIVKDGKEVLHEGYGIDTKESIYRIYSMTKLMTSVVVYKLYEQGDLNLTDDVSLFLPEFKYHHVYDQSGNVVPSKISVTLQHLLNMTSGMSYPGVGTPGERRMKQFEDAIIADLAIGKTYTTKEIMRLVASVPGDFEPGTSWGYGISADILGGVIEAITDKKLSEVFSEMIFEPLGMNDTAFFVPKEKLDRVSAITKRDNFSQTIEQLERHPLSDSRKDCLTMPLVTTIDTEDPVFLSGGGGIYSTASDYAKLMQMLLNKGLFEGIQLLKGETINLIIKPQLSDKTIKTMHASPVGTGIPGYSYSNLFRILTEPSKAQVFGVNGNVGEFGWDGAGGNFTLVDPTQNLVAVFMMQDLSGAEPILRRKLYKAICKN